MTEIEALSFELKKKGHTSAIVCTLCQMKNIVFETR